MYGSWWPEGPMGAQLYALHRCGLTEEQLRAVCAGNLERLLGAAPVTGPRSVSAT